jgi:multiple sugar transport system substrate-binding protein
MLYCRLDLLATLGRRPPETWDEYAELVELFRESPAPNDVSDTTPWRAAAEPLAPHWAARLLLARAAAYARHDDNYSTLFQVDTMEPLIAGPPFLRALAELVRDNPKSNLSVTPDDARRMIHRGQCALAITWPTAAAEIDGEDSPPLGIASLPGSTAVFDIGSGEWDTTPDAAPRRTVLLGAAGRCGSVSTACRNVPAACRLLTWLAGPGTSSQVSPVSFSTALFRKSQCKNASRWIESQLSDQAADSYAAILQQLATEQATLAVPTIPGVDEYLAVLDTAVGQVLRGDATEQAALDAAAAEWRDITARRNKNDSQRAAYRRSLGLEP